MRQYWFKFKGIILLPTALVPDFFGAQYGSVNVGAMAEYEQWLYLTRTANMDSGENGNSMFQTAKIQNFVFKYVYR